MITLSGRVISSPPIIRLDTNRKACMDLVKVEMWLLRQGKEEAIARNDDYFQVFIQGEKAGKLPQATKDCINQYLFG